MKTQNFGKWILAVCVTFIFSIASGCGSADSGSNDNGQSANNQGPVQLMSDVPAATDPVTDSAAATVADQSAAAYVGAFSSADLVGDWYVLLNGNGLSNFGWSFIKMHVDETGAATCIQYIDNRNGTTCGVLPKISITPKGLITTDKGNVYGIMSNNKASVYLTQIDSNAVSKIGTMTRAFDNFSAQSMVGTWTALLIDSTTYEFVYIKMNVNALGEAACVQYIDFNGVTACPELPNLTINPNGVITAGTTGIYGLMEYYGNSAYLFAFDKNGVTKTGTLTKVSNAFTTADLAGQWSVMLLENGATGFGWSYLVMNVNADGGASCVAYYDDKGNVCGAIPNLSITPNGIVSTANHKVVGVMNDDVSGAYIFGVEDGEVIKSGAMMRVY